MQVTSRFVHSEGAINLFKNVIGLSSFDDTTRTLVTFDVPMASGGLELSIFKTSGKIVAVDMASTQKYLEELTSAGPAGRQDRVGDPRRPLY